MQFKADVGPETINDVFTYTHQKEKKSRSQYCSTNGTALQACSRMLSLKEQCIHSVHQKPYIKSSKGGKECSVEGMQVTIFPKLCLCTQS